MAVAAARPARISPVFLPARTVPFIFPVVRSHVIQGRALSCRRSLGIESMLGLTYSEVVRPLVGARGMPVCALTWPLLPTA
eukprot:14629298-Heterocapsa_arctica.AAC.1